MCHVNAVEIIDHVAVELLVGMTVTEYQYDGKNSRCLDEN